MRDPMNGRHIRVMVASLAAAAPMVVSVAAAWPGSAASSAVAAPESTVEISEDITTWVPHHPQIGSPAPPGTALARQCSGECRWLLVSPDGTTADLVEVSPDLVEVLDSVAPEGVSISYDASWLAIHDNGTVRIYPLRPEGSRPGISSPLVFEPEGSERSWEFVAWGSGSLSAALVEYNDARPVRYGHADLLGGSTTVAEAPASDRYGPVGDAGIGPQVSDRVRAGERLTSARMMSVPVVPDPAWEVGSLQDADSEHDVTGLLAGAESLAGPAGLAEVNSPPREHDETVWPQVTVFRSGPEGFVRQGVIELGLDTDRRLEYAEAGGGWELRGMIRPDQAALTSVDEGESVLQGRGDEGVIWEHRLRGDATWYLPGLRQQDGSSSGAWRITPPWEVRIWR